MKTSTTAALCISTALLTAAIHSSFAYPVNKKLEQSNTTISIIEKEVHNNQKELNNLQNEMDKVVVLVDRIEDRLQLINAIQSNANMDVFKVTAYSPYDDVNGLNSDGDPRYTSTGVTPKEGTIAVNPDIIPYGSTVVILYDDGSIEVGRAEDTGGALRKQGNKQIDVFRHTFKEAMQHGVKEAVVLWYKEDN